MTSTHSNRLSTLTMVALLSVMAIALGACREDEKDRPLHYEKGSYRGQADHPLDEETIRSLRHRGSFQGD